MCQYIHMLGFLRNFAFELVVVIYKFQKSNFIYYGKTSLDFNHHYRYLFLTLLFIVFSLTYSKHFFSMVFLVVQLLMHDDKMVYFNFIFSIYFY